VSATFRHTPILSLLGASYLSGVDTAPAASAAAEAFVVCQHYAQPEGFCPEDLQRLMQGASHSYFTEQSEASRRLIVPFLACGDLSGWDADQSYDLPEEGYQTLPPVQLPTAPAYKTAIERAKQGRS